MTLPGDPPKWAVTAFRSGQNAEYDRYRNYIAGIQPLALASEPYRSAFGRMFADFSYNRCSAIVKSHANRLQVSGFASEPNAVAQNAQGIWDANTMDVREGHVSDETFGMGDAYVIVELHPQDGDVLIWTQEAQNVRVHYSDDRPGALDLASKYWTNEDGYGRLNLYFTGRIEKYVTRNKAPSGIPQSALAFERYEIDGEAWPMPLNIIDTVPVFHFANDGRTNAYGVSELQVMMSLQDSINKALKDLMAAEELIAFPQRAIIDANFDDPEAEESLRRVLVGMNRFITLNTAPGGPTPSIAEFTAANLSQWESVAENWDKRISRATLMPLHQLTMQGDFPSGRALRIAEGPFLSKLEDRQRAFGNVWSSVMEYAVRLSGMDVETSTLRVNWKSAAPLSEEDQLDRALQRDVIGIPFESNLKMLGYEPDQIEEILKLKEEAVREAMRTFDAGAVPAGFADEEKGQAA